MKKIFLLVMLVPTWTLVFSQPAKENLMPVTTNSKQALSLYNQAMKYFDDVKLDKGVDTFKKALAEDPDFFMADYQLAVYYLLNRDPDNFKTYADAAINSKAKLSNAEQLLKDALVTVNHGHLDVTEVGKKLVDMYPKDPNSYSDLINFQSLAGDSTDMVTTIQQAIKIAPDPAPFYNQLGYAYLALNESDNAEKAFDRYIELEPDNPNVYDSKGDYYMYIKKYDMAYDSYMKANSMDPSFSRDKAEVARQLYEQTSGQRLQRISI